MILGLDVGGTHTDAVIIDKNRVIASYKAVTDHTNLLNSMNQALEKVIEGIDPAKIQAVIEQEDSAMDVRVLKEKWLKRQRSEFREHLWAYIIINAALALINLFTPGPWWFQWPLICWGIGVAFHYRETHHPTEEAIEKGIEKMMRQEQKKREKLEKAGLRAAANREY